MNLTFAKAVRQGLENNSRILQQQRKIDALKTKLQEVETENEWQWEAAVEGRSVSNNTRTTSQKKFATLEGEREFRQGLKIKPEISLREKELLESGLNQESIDFEIELEQPLYPVLNTEDTPDYKILELKLKAAEIELQQLKRKLLIKWLDDYLELIELKLEEKICSEELDLAKELLIKQQAEQPQSNKGRKKILAAKIDVNEAQQDVEEVKNDYQKSLRTLKSSLGLGVEHKLEVSITKECDLHWLAELEEELPNLDNSQQLLAQAKTNSKELLMQQLEEEQLKQEQKEQKLAEKPELNLNANYESGTNKWQIAVDLSHKLFNHQEDELIREKLSKELAALKEEGKAYLRKLKGKIDDLVGEITVNQLKVAEEKLRLEEVVLDLEEVEQEKATDEINDLEYQEEKLNLKKAELGLQERKHQLLLSKYELIKLLGGLNI